MGAKFERTDTNQILNNEFRISVLENVFDLLLQKNPDLTDSISPQDIEKIREQVADKLKNKYPNLGIEYKKIA